MKDLIGSYIRLLSGEIGKVTECNNITEHGYGSVMYEMLCGDMWFQMNIPISIYTIIDNNNLTEVEKKSIIIASLK